MRLISLLGMVATVASGLPLNQVEKVELLRVGLIAADIFVEKQGNSLIFKKVSNPAEITSELLDADLDIAPYIVFSLKDSHWSAEQTMTIDMFKRLLKVKENDGAYKVAIIGADKINDSVDKCNIKLNALCGALLVEMSPQIDI